MSNVYANFIYDFIIDLSYYINQDFAAPILQINSHVSLRWPTWSTWIDE